MKISNYNFFHPYDEPNRYVAYNSFTNALALVDAAKYQAYLRFEEDNAYALDDTFMNSLRKGGFVIEDAVDEIALLRHKLWKSRYAGTGLGLTLAPTSGCNFRCVYCYEKDHLGSERMSEETQQAIVRLVEGRASLQALGVSWYGGEPLLAMDIIESMTEQFLALAEKHAFQYSATIVTNGYLLTPEIAERLVQCGIVGCQITLDGERDTHDVRRPHVSGGKTYDTILENLKAVDGILPSINVRVNIDRENQSAVQFIQDTINEMHLKTTTVYPAAILNSNGCHSAEACLGNEEYATLEYGFIRSNQDGDRLLNKYPVLRGNYCGADAANAYVIGADGEMYKCWADIGVHGLSFGNVNGGKHNAMNEIRYMQYDPTQAEGCSTCKFLPICLGGCPHARTETTDNCMYYGDLQAHYLQDIAREIKRRK